MKQRIDKLLVERGLAESRERAQALILAGEVLVEERRIEKSGERVEVDAVVRLKSKPMKYVSRGGLKLEAALERFSILVEGCVCLDIGSSTGGFTDCLLQRGAAKVYAVDVGTNQLDWKLRKDPRVVSREQVNARNLNFEIIGEKVDLVVVDVSFISLELVFPALLQFSKSGTQWVVLVKPQFEVGKGRVGKGGIVRDPELQSGAVEKVRQAAENCGLKVEGSVESPIKGMEGNREFFLWLAAAQ